VVYHITGNESSGLEVVEGNLKFFNLNNIFKNVFQGENEVGHKIKLSYVLQKVTKVKVNLLVTLILPRLG
jgi:hypothetical protein